MLSLVLLCQGKLNEIFHKVSDEASSSPQPELCQVSNIRINQKLISPERKGEGQLELQKEISDKNNSFFQSLFCVFRWLWEPAGPSWAGRREGSGGSVWGDPWGHSSLQHDQSLEQANLLSLTRSSQCCLWEGRGRQTVQSPTFSHGQLLWPERHTGQVLVSLHLPPYIWQHSDGKVFMRVWKLI